MRCQCRVNKQGGPPLRLEEGSFLVAAVLFLSFVLTLVLSTMSVVTSKVQDVRHSRNQMVARQAAISGANQAIADIKTARDYAAITTAFGGIDALDTNVSEGVGGFTQAYNGQTLSKISGGSVAEYDVVIDVTDRSNLTQRTVNIVCFAYVPTKADYTSGLQDAVRADASCSVTVSISGSSVFDYSYFINHWGWFFGNTIIANGSVRSNGQFDFGGYASTVNGSPRYLGSDSYKLVGYQDDNKDGVTDGSDGGVYSGWDIVNENRVQGMGAIAKNQHSYDGGIEMPNLSDLSYYETKAKDTGASITLGGATVVGGVEGDTVGEQQNLYLVGTAARPITINGPVVVRGSVIISGYVTGKGAIYAGGNVYIPNNLIYVNPPTTWRPASNDQATTEAWRNANLSKDALGLFAREHVVLSNYTNSSWQSYVSSWVNNSNNKSVEDAGSDGVQNTKAGRDGILGTADDDVLEGDNTWTVSYYTAADQAKGIIPAGKTVGSVISGSGEDIDGDGVYDAATSMSQFNIPAALTSTNWAGNVPPGSPSFSSVSTIYMSRVDAALYTNHTLATLMLNSGGDIAFNGSIVSRNESIVYGSNHIYMNHDERLSGHGGDLFGFYNPISWQPMTVGSWQFDRDLPASILGNPSSITSYFTTGPLVSG